MKKIVIILGLIILVLVVVYYVGSNNTTDIPAQNEDEQKETQDDRSAGLRIGQNSIYVTNQKPNFNEGNELNVSLASFANSGYIVIHEDNNGSFGDIIGTSKLLPKGDNSNVSLNITRETMEGETLYAMLHADNGDTVFNAADDSPIISEGGSPIFMIFTIDSFSDGETEAISL